MAELDPKTLLDSLDEGVVAIAPDWTVTEWTARAAAITGLPADRVLGQNFWIVFPTAKGSHVERVLQDVLADGTPRSFVTPARAPEFQGLVFETRVTRALRNYLVLQFRPVRDEIDPESRAAQILTAFETERRLYRQLFEALPSPAFVLSVDGQILEANPQAADLLGVPEPRSLRGRSLAEWALPAQRPALAAALRDAIRNQQRIRFAIDFAGEPTSEVDAVIVNIAATQESAKLFFLGVDVSREVLLQRKLLQADRLSQLGALVSGVAHELNNPLAAISAFAELLGVDAQTPELKESAEIIHTEAIRAGRVIQTLLDFARQRPRQAVALDLQDVVERVLALHRSALKKARVQAVVRISDQVPPILGDPQELQQVLLNAIVNAQQAIESAGRPGKIFVTARRTDDHAVVEVEDTGPGVPPELLERVFEPFFTTKGEAGTGLGLAISFGLVKSMGGRIWMENIEGGGARLVLELPTEEAAPQAVQPIGFRPAARRFAILVVEDEQSVRRGMARMAERLGHSVTSVSGFEEALARLRAADTRYDALVVDVHLDEAHTGFDLFEELRQEGRGRERRLVFTTGDSISASTRDQLQRSERPVLRKPFKLEELRDVLDRVAE